MSTTLSVLKVDPAQLRSLFRVLTRAALASAWLSGCASEGDVVPEGDAGSQLKPSKTWDPILCGEYPPSATGSINPAVPVSHVAIYGPSPYGYNQIINSPRLYAQFRYGLCADGTDGAACSTRLGGLANQECGDDCGGTAVVEETGKPAYTADLEQLRALLGPVDTSAEALLLAAMEGLQMTCPATYYSPKGKEIELRGTEVRLQSDGYHVRSEYELCGIGAYRTELRIDAEGIATVVEETELGSSLCAIGRRPDGLCAAPAVHGHSAIGDYFAQCARLEAASVHAFLQLARELTALHAPRELVDACLRAVCDEVRHAAIVAELASARGGEMIAPQVVAQPLRSAFEIARENAVEGCVRETYGALLATYQAETARDLEVRAAMLQIAEDESMHARLSWQLAQWLEPQLSEGQRAELASLRRDALQELRGQLDLGLSDQECAEIGLPSVTVARQLLDSLDRTLWS